MPRAIAESAAIAVIAVVVALVVNAIRDDGIPLVAREAFEILVPCPQPMGEATAIGSDSVVVRDPTSLVIDVRSSDEYASWHLPGSLHQPFDWLAEQKAIDREAGRVAQSIARSGKRAVVVYGDGGNPDSGEHWAALLTAAGIKNVVFVSGGAASLRKVHELSGREE